jgi:hypothetical protein
MAATKLKIWQHGGRVYLDKQQGIGSWDEHKNKEGDFGYNFKSANFNQPLPGGLYLITLTLKSGKQTEGWFFITPDLNSSQSPQVHSPHYGEAFKTGKPTFTFENYFSPEYKSHEIRTLWVGVMDERWKDIWEMWERSPHRTSVSLDDPKSEGARELSSGNYNFMTVNNEGNKFGDVFIMRSSVVVRPFTVLE